MSASDRPTVAGIVDAALVRTHLAMRLAGARRDRGQLTDAEWTAAMARLYTRRARWWAVLDRATRADHGVHTVYIRAVLLACSEADRDAWHWTEQARTTTGQTSSASHRVEAG